jgi:hypothetical protein
MKRLTAYFFLITLFVAGCNLWKDKKTPLLYHVLESKKTVEDTTYYKILKNYPEFIADDEKLKPSLDNLNQAIVNFVDTLELYYWGTDIDGAKQIKYETGAAGLFELLNKFTILDTTNRFISIQFETFSYALGAHGFTGLNTFNFDLNTAKFIQFPEVIDFSKPENIDTLNTLLKKHFVNSDTCFTTQPTVIPDFKRFGLSRDFLFCYFEAYELGAYYCGSATVKVPVDELKRAGLWILGKN